MSAPRGSVADREDRFQRKEERVDGQLQDMIEPALPEVGRRKVRAIVAGGWPSTRPRLRRAPTDRQGGERLFGGQDPTVVRPSFYSLAKR